MNYEVGQDELLPFVPTELDAEQINYGQGEGQIRVENCQYGIYIDKDDRRNPYFIQFEHGDINAETFTMHIDAIRVAAESYFGTAITTAICGCWDDVDDSFNSG